MTDFSPPSSPAPGSASAEFTAVPRHLAIIMDGNGRWARQRGLSRSEGHKAGTEAARGIVEESLSLGIRHLTLYTFSRENWKRPAEEVRFLFDLLVEFITRELPDLERRGVSLRILGEEEGLPFAARKTLAHACRRTARGDRMILNLALNYSGRDEIVRACRLWLADALQGQNGEVQGADGTDGGKRFASVNDARKNPALRASPPLTPEMLSGYLYTAGQPDPDLVIRTSGEQRISNFLLFQTAYSEFYFTETLWPDFSPAELRRALAVFGSRSRRFGAVNDAPAT